MNTDENVHPVVKAELLAKYKILGNGRLVEFLKKRSFQCLRDQDCNEKVPSFSHILKNIEVKKIFTPNYTWEIIYKFKKSEGKVKIRLHNKFDPDKPTFVYHHALWEIYHPKQINIIFDRVFLEKFNVFTVKASHHEAIKQILNSYINTLTNFATGIAASVAAYEEVINLVRNASRSPIVICGTSLGGIITSLHYYHKCSADLYFPIVSYPNLSEIILTPQQNNGVPNQNLLKKNPSIKNCFKIPLKYMKRPKNKIYPVLGKYDLTINYQHAKKWWKGYNVKTFTTGHTSIFIKKKEIQNYILSKLE